MGGSCSDYAATMVLIAVLSCWIIKGLGLLLDGVGEHYYPGLCGLLALAGLRERLVGLLV